MNEDMEDTEVFEAEPKVLTHIPYGASDNAVAIAEAVQAVGGTRVAVAKHLGKDMASVSRWCNALTATERDWLRGLGFSI